jgi:glycosyltransferase involved in cell wall biosynthesis
LAQPLPKEFYTIRYFRCSPLRRYKFSLGLLAWLWDHAGEYDIAHIHALFSPISTAAATVARQQQLPYVMRPLGTLDPADLQKKRWLKQLYGRLWEKPNLAGAAAIHFTSPMEARVSHRFGTTTQDLIIPLGVEPQPELSPTEQQKILAQLGVPTDQPILLYLSRLDPKKGLDLLLPALEQLAAEGIPFHFILAGANPQDQDYEQAICDRITHSPLSQLTTRTGFVRGAVKAALLQSADLFVLPSYYENFGIAVAEAMMAGVPVVISTGVYIWQDIIDGDGGWVCDLTVAGVADALRQGLTQPQVRQEKGKLAQDYAMEHYSWKAIAQHTLATYEMLLKQFEKGVKQ